MEITVKQDKDILYIQIACDVNLYEIGKLERALNGIDKFNEIHIELLSGHFVNSAFFSLVFNVKNRYPDKRIAILNPNKLMMDLIKTTKLSDVAEVVFNR
jgi:hypothetical protein